MASPSRSEATSTHQTSPFLRGELVGVDVGRRKKRTADVAGKSDLLSLAGLVIGLGFAGLRFRRKSRWRPGSGADFRGGRLAGRQSLRRDFLEREAIEMPVATLVGEVVHLDDAGSVGVGGEIDHSSRAIHENVPPLLVGHDHHRRQFRIDSHGSALDGVALALA